MNVIDILFEQPSFNKIVFKLSRVFTKAPHIPAPLMEFLTDILPVLFALMGILHGVIGALIIVTAANTLQISMQRQIGISPMYLLFNGMLAIANGLFLMMSYSDVRHRSIRGWKSLVIISAISILQTLMALAFFPNAFFNSFFYIVVMLYITFEFKPYFKDNS